MRFKNNQRFSSISKMKRSADYLKARKLGKRLKYQNFTVFLIQSPTDKCRLGITASRKTGNAIKRNRIKRLLREFFRLNRNNLPQKLDISIICKPNIPDLTYSDVYKQLRSLFEETLSGEDNYS